MRIPIEVRDPIQTSSKVTSAVGNVTDGVGRPVYRVLVHGLEFFSRRLPAAFASDGWQIRHNSVHSLRSLGALARDLRSADLIFSWGARISFGKFLRVARILNKRNVVFFWAGSDVLGAQMQFAEGIREPWIAAKIHWAGAPWLAEEIRAIGLECEYVPITWVPKVERPHPLPDTFSVLTYLPATRQSSLYGLDRILHVARSLPYIPFELVGLTEGRVANPPSNLRVWGRLNNMDEVYRRTSLYWRPVSHDGLSFMALEALSHGRQVLWSYPFPHCYQSRNAQADRAEILRLYLQHQRGELLLNTAAIAMTAEKFSVASIKNEYLRRWEEIICSSGELRQHSRTPSWKSCTPPTI